MFVGNATDNAGDHTLYSCRQDGFAEENFVRRTTFVIIPTNEGYVQIYDTDHKAYLFVGHGQDNGGDHTVYACPDGTWKNNDDFLKRTAWSFVPVESGFRLQDRDHNCFIFVGNGNDGGDHTLYAVPQEKFNENSPEWHGRTCFDIQGGITMPVNRQMKACDLNHGAHLFVGNSTDYAGDHTVYACVQSGFAEENFHRRANIVITNSKNGNFQIMDTDHSAFLFVGNGQDDGGDHTVYACPQNIWKDENDYIERTAWTLEHVENNQWRIRDVKHKSYLFVGNGDEGGDHTLYACPDSKMYENQEEWGKRTLWVFTN
jgi:ribosomal protein L27